MRLRTNKSQKLQPVRDRHSHVENDGVRMDAVGQLESRFRRQRGLDAEPFQLEHPGERVGHRPVVVNDKDRPRRLVGDAFGRGNHCIILKVKDMARQGRGRRGIGFTIQCPDDTL